MKTPTIITTEVRIIGMIRSHEIALDPIRVAAAIDAAGYGTEWPA